MSRVVVTRAVPVSTPAVWDAFVDLTYRSVWLSEVDSVDVLTPGPLVIGSRWRQSRLVRGGRAIAEDLVVTAVEPGRGCTVALVGAAARHRLSYTFTPVEVGACRGGTTVSVTVERQPRGFVDRVLTVLLGGFVARTVEGALRQHVEAFAAGCLAHRSARSAAA
jgi:hypothetical protein